jgi:signal transduction histidine kinase
MESVRVNDAVSRVAWEFGDRSDVEFELSLTPSSPTIRGNQLLLEQAMRLLIGNALDAMPNGGVLRLSTHVHEDVVVTITDSGVGMDEATKRRVFEPFYTTKGPRGTGLGLSVVFGIVTRVHGGTVQLESKPGAGTTVTLRLPKEHLSYA